MADVSAQVDKAKEKFDFDANNYTAELATTKGVIKLEFFPDVAPGHVRNFLALSDIGFYNGLTFHRIIKGFMIQGGCPNGTGTGGPGYTIDAEFNDKKHEPGVLSMARTNDPNSAGSQFFICLEAQPSLDNKYTVFGKAVDPDSLNVVREIGVVPTDANDRPLENVLINEVSITATPK